MAPGRPWQPLRQVPWDVLVLDMFLREGTGLEVLAQLPGELAGRKVYVLTNYATADLREACVRLGRMRCSTNPPSWTSSSPPFWRDAVGVVWSTQAVCVGDRALAAFAFAHVVLQGQQGRPSRWGRARPPLARLMRWCQHSPRTSPRCASAWKRSISWGSCKTMGCAELVMARSSLVSMVNFHWPLVRGETEIQSVLPRRSRSESPLYAHRVK